MTETKKAILKEWAKTEASYERVTKAASPAGYELAKRIIDAAAELGVDKTVLLNTVGYIEKWIEDAGALREFAGEAKGTTTMMAEVKDARDTFLQIMDEPEAQKEECSMADLLGAEW